MSKLHPNLKQWLDNFNPLVEQLVKNGFKATPTNAREGLANLTKNLVTNIPDVAMIVDDYIKAPHYAIPVRIYNPEPQTILPVLIYYHGGGHMSGSVTVYDPICRKLAVSTKHIVVSVDYRLAPECPYPAGITDAYWAAKNIWHTLNDRNINYSRKLSIIGDSGGGALAAYVAQRAQFDFSLSLHKQILIYPSLDYTMNFSSIVNNGQGYLLSKEKIAWYFDNYFAHGEDRYQASPLYGQITSKLASCFLVTAGFCPLLDEGLAYVEKLRQSTVTIQHYHYEDMIHTFINMENIVPEACAQLYQKIALFLTD